MKTSDLLLIRACKSENNLVRVKKIYHRFYGRYDDDVTHRSLVIILSEIVDTYVPLRLIDTLSKIAQLQHDNIPLKNSTYVVWLINVIAYAEIKKFPGYIAPLRHRS